MLGPIRTTTTPTNNEPKHQSRARMMLNLILIDVIIPNTCPTVQKRKNGKYLFKLKHLAMKCGHGQLRYMINGGESPYFYWLIHKTR